MPMLVRNYLPAPALSSSFVRAYDQRIMVVPQTQKIRFCSAWIVTLALGSAQGNPGRQGDLAIPLEQKSDLLRLFNRCGLQPVWR